VVRIPEGRGQRMRFLSLKIIMVGIMIFLVACCSLGTGPDDKSKNVRMSEERLKLIDTVIGEAIARKDFPGAVVLVGRENKIVYRRAFGESQWVPLHRKMEPDMIFDLASITKPVATATSIMILVERGKLSLWEKVKDYVPEFSLYIDDKGQAGEDARLWHLLTHTSGLPDYTDAKVAEEKLGKLVPTETLVNYIAQLKKESPPGEAFKYSCLGYITLAYIIKKVSGQNVAEFSAEHIFEPLKMKHSFFKPREKFRELCVPTEVVKGKPLTGIVHDPLARLQGGVSGNAGLFSTADDLAIFAQMLLNSGEKGKIRILGPLAVERMTEIYPRTAFSGRSLGWDLDSEYSSNGGDLFGPRSYGHTGYTGTSIWIDPETKTYVIFLTNRVHPDDKGAIITIRSRIANIVASAILKK
jgi:CubicO group peptidase (beta-lactamase class C family)